MRYSRAHAIGTHANPACVPDEVVAQRTPVRHSSAHAQGDDLLAMQRRTLTSHGRAFPLGVRTDSSNMDVVLGWRAGIQMVALNLQTNDLQTQVNALI